MAGATEEQNPVPGRNHGNPKQNYHGFWYPKFLLPGAIAAQQRFHPRSTDILLASTPKTGSTWLKALLFATTTRKSRAPSDPNHPLLFKHPRQKVPLLEESFQYDSDGAELEALPSPRVIATHIPHQHLPRSITDSDSCKLVYICRDPKDTLVSLWHFRQAMAHFSQRERELYPFDAAFENFFEGTSPYGPMWEHWLGYWNASLRAPSKVLFLKYEDMVQDGAGNLKRLAEFIGFPFSEEEEEAGVVQDIVKLCSFEKLSGLEVNKSGEWTLNGVKINYSSYFRKGKVGDWKNYFTKEMAEKLDEFVQQKLSGSGLSFDNFKQDDGSGMEQLNLA